MTQERQTSEPTNEKQRLVADFMLTEFNALVERARDLDQINAARINFYLIIVAAVGAGLGGTIEFLSTLPEALWIVLLALLALLVLGLVTYYYAINSAIATVMFYRTAGRIRCWFADLDPESVRYFAFVPADNRPHFTTSIWMFRGGEAIVTAINAILASGIIVALLYQYQVIGQIWEVVAVAVVVWPFAWFLQRLFFMRKMKLEEDRSNLEDIHFEDKDYEALFQASRHILTDTPEGGNPSARVES